MLDTKDLYTYQILKPINDDTGVRIGTTIIAYEIRRYIDVRNLKNTFAYQIFCTQRIIIPGAYTPGSTDSIATEYTNYSAIVSNTITPDLSTKQLWIVDYSPRTINASINQTLSDDSSSGTGASWQQTIGSSTAESNTFGASASLGIWGTDPNASVSVNASQTSSTGTNNSTTSGTQSNIGSVSSIGDSFSIKEWAAYAFTDTADSQITWVWGQEYPWDVLQYRDGNEGNIVPPSFVQDIMQSPDGQLLPPSLLSQFGVDFTMKAAWIVEPTAGGHARFQHEINYYTGSHQWQDPSNPSTISCSLNSLSTPNTINTTKLDLYTYGLDPITNEGITQTAIVGFIPQQFSIEPSTVTTAGKAPGKFKILSLTNNLLIEDSTAYSSSVDVGAGFSPSETALTATFSKNCTSLSMNVSFKVISMSNNFRLYLKHWIVGAQSVNISIAINGNTVEKLVDDLEGEGGEDNLLNLYLRNLDFGSVNYQDFLQLGLNQLTITLTPNGTDYTSTYQLRALSIETG